MKAVAVCHGAGARELAKAVCSALVRMGAEAACVHYEEPAKRFRRAVAAACSGPAQYVCVSQPSGQKRHVDLALSAAVSPDIAVSPASVGPGSDPEAVAAHMVSKVSSFARERPISERLLRNRCRA